MSSRIVTVRRAIRYFAVSCLAFAGLAAAAPFDSQRVPQDDVRITRDFTNVEYGQLHFRLAQPIDEDRIQHSPVVCFHQTPNSSQVYVEFMAELARDRLVFAVDTPGLGESDLPAEAPEIRDYAIAMGQFLTAQDLAEVDVVGYHTGASIAVELANLQPARVKSMMLVGLALFNDEERAGFFEQPWPKPTKSDGSHLLDEWRRSQQWRGPGQSDQSVRRTFLQKLLPGDAAWWGARAVMRHDLQSAIKQVSVPFLAVNANDDLFTVTPRLKSLRKDREIVTFGDHGFGIFEVQPSVMAARARQWFDEAN